MSEQANMRGFTFFFNYYTAISQSGISLEEQAKAYNAICAYVFFGEEPKCDGAGSLVVNLLKPSLNISIKNAENGRKRNGKEAKQKRNVSQTEAKRKRTEAKRKRTGVWLSNRFHSLSIRPFLKK